MAWEVPGQRRHRRPRAQACWANGIDTGDAKIQTLSGAGGDRIRVQVGDQPADVQTAVRETSPRPPASNSTT